ncbi:hypothetical protein [Baekduia sp. Peel2402]|uniref:hypothetical protein n=1 Tax=Baekduia sp. Peel2402 TaxID=3458296 RepID=UPI00403EE549
MAASPPPRLVVGTERRHGWVKAGAIMIAVGALILAIGAATAWLAQTTHVAFAADRAEIPHPLRFDSGGRHELLLLADPAVLRRPYQANAIAQMSCVVDKPDGTRQTIDLSYAATRTESSVGEQMAAFETPPGGTTVVCDFDDHRTSSNYFYVVARARKSVAVAAIALFVGGLLLLFAGVWVLGVGWRGRAVIRNREAGSADPA